MGLNKREVAILKILTESNEFIPVRNIAERLNISTKTAYRDIERILQKRTDIVLEKKQGSGIKLKFTDELIPILNSKKIIKYSIKERRLKILFELLKNSKSYTSIEQLSTKYFVSKSSIIKDLDFIEKKFLNEHLKINKTRNGTKIEGSEKKIREKLKQLFTDYSYAEEGEFVSYTSERINKETLAELSSKFEISKIEKIEYIIEKYEKRLPYTIGEEYYINLIVHILIAIERVRTENYIDLDYNINLISDKKYYNEAENIAIDIEKAFNIILPASEIYYIYQYLVSTGVGNINDNNKIIVDDNIENIVQNFIKMMANMSINIKVDSSVLYIFKLHIRALLRRLKYGIKIKNPLVEKIKNDYSYLFSKIRKEINLLLGEEVSDDEVAYLTIYIESILANSNIQKNVILVCHSGFGTSQFLKKRIEDTFDNLKIIAVISSGQLDNYNMTDIDFIISTVKLTKNFGDVVNVSVLLTEEDIEKINYKIGGR